MAADLDAGPGASEVSNVEFEGQESLSLPSREDPPKVGGDCNGIVHHGDKKIHGETKDDGDGSYGFVDGADSVSDGRVDAECTVDPTEVAEGDAVVEEKTVSELNGRSLQEERQVKTEELKMEQKGNSESNSDGNGVSLSEVHDLSSEFSQCQSNGNGVEKSYSVDEKNRLESAARVEGDHESLIMPDTACGHELPQSADEEKIEEEEEENKSEAGVTVEEKQELPRSVDEEKIEEENKLEAAVMVEEKQQFPQSGNDDKIEEENKSEAAVTVEEQQFPQSAINDKLEKENKSEAVVTVEEEQELPQSANNDKIEEENKSGTAVTVEEKKELPQSNDDEIEEENKLEAPVTVEEKHESELMVTEEVEPLVLQVSNGDAKTEAYEVKEVVDPMVLQLSNGEAKAEVQDGHQTDIPNAVELKLNQLDNCEEKVEEINKLQPNGETEKNQFDDKEEKVEEQSELDSSADVMADQDNEIVTLVAVEIELHHLDNGEKENGKFTAEVPLEKPTEQLEDENKLIMDVAAFPVDDVQLESGATDGTENGSGKSVPTFPVEEIVSEVEVACSESAGVPESRPPSDANDTESEYKNENGSVVYSKNFTAGYWKTGIVFGDLPAANGVAMYGSPSEYAVPEPELGNSSVERDENSLSCSVDCERLTENGPIKNDHDESTIPVDDPQMNREAGNISTAVNDDMQNDDDVNKGSQLLDVSVSIGENTSESVKNAIDLDDEGSPSVSGDSDGKQGFEEADTGEGIESNGNPPSPIENSTIDPFGGQKVDEEAAKRLFFLIRIPRYLDNKIRHEIGLAQMQVDERTRTRDAVRSSIHLKKATSNEYRDKFEAARSEERAAWDVFNTKRQEMDSVQSVLNRMKNATSIDDIDERIQSMEHRIEHETVPLKEEKQLIREIKQLKHVREQLCASLGRQAEVQPTSEQKERIEERFKLLKQELDSARNEVLRAEGITRVAKKTYFDENEKLKELQGQFRAADDLRQEAYAQLQNLKKQSYDKNKYFRMYKEDVRKAEDYAFRGDREALQQLCVNQVETIMDLWNKNDEFRNEYVRCNMNSTLRRFKTLDGRRLGPDEEPPLLRSAVDEKVDNTVVSSDKINSTSLFSTSDQGTSVQPLVPNLADVNSVVNLENKNLKADIKSVVNQEQKASTKSKKVIKKSIALENSSATVSGREGMGENAEVSKKTLEEEELARKEEELRKEEAAAKLKEQQRLEEKAKAKEAEERKKRNAEKAQARAELRAKKEAELKEREREKRARKKERKQAAAAAEVTDGAAEEKSASGSEISQHETTQESEVQKKPTTVAKRPQKPSLLAKQTKTKALPPPLRNKGKRRMQPWMWVLPTVVLVLAFLFYVGNSGYSFKFATNGFGF